MKLFSIDHPRPLRVGILAFPLALILGVALFSPSSPAHAATTYQLAAEWASEPPQPVAAGTVVSAEIRLSINDDAAAPGNEAVADNSVTISAQNGRFTTLPAECRTDQAVGSSLSVDRRSLSCNLGGQVQGTAIVLGVPVTADGPDQSKLRLTAKVGDATATTPDLTLTAKFTQDMSWTNPTTWSEDLDGTKRRAAFNWTLSTGNGSPAGPDSLTYTIPLTAASMQVTDLACAPSDMKEGGQSSLSGHPVSAEVFRDGTPVPSDRRAPYVSNCSVSVAKTPGGQQVITLTISGIDYSKQQVPTKSASGVNLPTDRQAVATGVVLFTVDLGQNSSGTVGFPSVASPAYQSGGLSATDETPNNSATRTFTRAGNWYARWGNSTNTGNIVRAPGQIWSFFTIATNFRAHYSYPLAPYDEHTFGMCNVLDTRNAKFTGTNTVVGLKNANSETPITSGITYAYYTGSDARLNPASGAAYNPRGFLCYDDPSGWSTTAPADWSTVKAVRAIYRDSDMIALGVANTVLHTQVRVDSDAVTDGSQGVWMVGQNLSPYGWGNGGTTLPSMPHDALYSTGSTTSDFMRIAAVTTTNAVTTDSAIIRPGTPLGVTAAYSLNSSELGGDAWGGAVLVRLPVGLEYKPGSALSEPTIEIDAQGRQILTWQLETTQINTTRAIDFQALPKAPLTPGTTLKIDSNTQYPGAPTASSQASVVVTNVGATTIGKSTTQALVTLPENGGEATAAWSVTVKSTDLKEQKFTDVIDVLPSDGDARGSSFTGTFSVDVTSNEGTVYYTDATPDEIRTDPADPSNGSAGDVTGNTIGWSTTKPTKVTGVRVIAGTLASGAMRTFDVHLTVDGAHPGDVYYNRADGRSEHTRLVMSTSSAVRVADDYAAELVKEVQRADGTWTDADTVESYPTVTAGQSLRFRITIRNAGSGELTDVAVTDERFPAGDFAVEKLARGASKTHEFTVSTTPSDVGTIINTATATASGNGTAVLIDPESAGVVVKKAGGNPDPGGDPVDPQHPENPGTPAGPGAKNPETELPVTGTSMPSPWLPAAALLLLAGAAGLLGARRRASHD